MTISGDFVKTRELAAEEFVPLMLGIVGALGVIPFVILRFLNGEIGLAVLDATLVAGLLGLSAYLYKSHNVRLVSRALTLLAALGALATVAMLGSQQVFWLYPVLVGAFFLTSRHEALIIAVGSMLIYVALCAEELTAVALTTTLMTIAVTCSLAYAFATVTRNQRDALMKLATKDPLTGAGNRRALEDKLEDIIAAKSRSNKPSSLLMLDLDHFKQVNDEFGHAAGDEILIQITEIIKLRIRRTDNVFRIGGEEFVVVAETQNIKNASRLAEQLRTIIEANELAPAESVTISLGVAEYRHGESAKDWLLRADTALYQAKNSGRNNTKLAA